MGWDTLWMVLKAIALILLLGWLFVWWYENKKLYQSLRYLHMKMDYYFDSIDCHPQEPLDCIVFHLLEKGKRHDAIEYYQYTTGKLYGEARGYVKYLEENKKDLLQKYQIEGLDEYLTGAKTYFCCQKKPKPHSKRRSTRPNAEK
jgi:hypothetical protein